MVSLLFTITGLASLGIVHTHPKSIGTLGAAVCLLVVFGCPCMSPRNWCLATSSDSFRIYNDLQYRLCRICFFGLVCGLSSDEGMVCSRTALKFVSIGVWMRTDADRSSSLCGSRCGAM